MRCLSPLPFASAEEIEKLFSASFVARTQCTRDRRGAALVFAPRSRPSFLFYFLFFLFCSVSFFLLFSRFRLCLSRVTAEAGAVIDSRRAERAGFYVRMIIRREPRRINYVGPKFCFLFLTLLSNFGGAHGTRNLPRRPAARDGRLARGGEEKDRARRGSSGRRAPRPRHKTPAQWCTRINRTVVMVES